jgi:hypothetical protein
VKRSLAWLSVLGALLPTPALADSVAGTRSELLLERDHVIRVSLDHGHAELVVRRTVHNGGERHDQAMFWIDVPEGSVAAGLRTLGELNGRPKWFAGELLEAETAAARYRELTGIGGYYPKDPALLSWRSSTNLALQVFPVAPASNKTIEYTLHMPMAWEEGRWTVTLPRLGTEELAADAVISPAHRLDQVFVDGQPTGPSTRVVLNDEVKLALARRDPPRLSGALAVEPAGEQRVLVHWDVEAAPELGAIPDGTHVVVAVDASRSLAEHEVEAGITAARATLHAFAEVPGARAEVLVFDRHVRATAGAMAPVADVLALLEGAAPQQANGSHVDVVLERAAALLATAPRGASKRVVVITDAMTRSALGRDRLAAFAKQTDALVHVAAIDEGDAEIARDDEHDWAALVRPTGGLVWAARAEADPTDPFATARVFEELARPVRIHELRVAAPGIPADDLTLPATLDEGTGLDDLRFVARRVPHVVVTGELWAQPIKHVLRPDPDAGELWAGLVFGTSLIEELPEADMMVLAMRGKVVSPVTSYLAIEPGVRPSTEGLDEGEAFGVGGLGLIGTGFGGGGAGHGIGRARLDRDAFLRARLREAGEACGVGKATLRATLETTLAEVVDVVSVTAGDAVAQTCVSERLWAIELPGDFDDALRSWSVKA